MEKKYTPGPWKCSQHLGHHVWSVHMDAGYRGRGSTIVDGVAGIDIEQRLANARIIAAAPELLEALNELANGYSGNRWDVGIALRLKKARAAIAKATGEPA